MRPASHRGLGRRGWVAAEFALVAPIFFLIALGAADLVSLLRAQLRADTVAVQIGQIVSQCRRITAPGDVSPLWAHAERIAGNVIDVNSPTGGATIISAVSRNNNANRLSWQIRTGNVSQTSSVGATQGGAATISNGFVVPAGQTLFVTEVYAVVRPWVLSAGLIGTALPSVINGTTLFLSRAPDPVALQAPPAASNVPDCTA